MTEKTEPAPPATTNADDDSKAKPRGRAKAKQKAAHDVLVFNSHGGPYVAMIVSENPNAPRGAGKNDPQLKKLVEKVVIVSGLHLLTGAQHEHLSGNQGYSDKVAAHELLELSEPDEDWPSQWLSLRSAMCRDMIKNTSGAEILEAILEVEEREDLVEVLEAQLEALKGDAKGRTSARAIQRRTNRKTARRAARSGLGRGR